MYTADALTVSYLATNTREYDMKLEIYDGGVLSSTVLQSDGLIYPFKIDHSIQPSSFFTIGTIHSSGLRIPLDSSVSVPINGEFKVFFRLNGDSGYGDWIPMGVYFVDRRYPSGSNIIDYQCYDEIIRAESTYVSALSYPTTVQAVWNEIVTALGLTSSITLPTISVPAALSGDTHRIALGDIAAICGGSLITNRTGELDVSYPYVNSSPSLVVTTGQWNDFKRIDDVVKTISRVTCIYDSGGNYVTLGDDTGYEMQFSCRIIRNVAQLQSIFDKYDGITFVPYSSLGWIGDPRVEVGDYITVNDDDGVSTHNVFVMTNGIDYGGGMSIINSSTVESVEASEFNVSYGLAKFTRQAVKQGIPYYGTTIDTEYGLKITRSDGVSETTINSDEWEVVVNGVRKLYANYGEDELYFNGKFTVDVLEALETVITANLTAGKAYIAELTVDQLDTSDAVQNYLDSDVADIEYIQIQDEEITFTTASTTGTSDVQVTNRDDELLWWTDDTETGSSSTITAYPVMRYVYELEELKMSIMFELIDGEKIPTIIMGAGTGTADNGKMKIAKLVDGFQMVYNHSTTGAEHTLTIGDDGIIQSGSVGNEGLRNIAISVAQPTTPQNNDLWIDTDA